MSANPLELFETYSNLGKTAKLGKSLRQDRRKRIRTTVHWPILMFRSRGAQAIETVTKDLNSDGFYCLSATPFAEGEALICTLRIPTHDPMGREPARTLECKVRVMRVEAVEADGLFGIACRIEDYRFTHLDAHKAH